MRLQAPCCASLRFNDLVVTRVAPKGRASWLPFRSSTCVGVIPQVVRNVRSSSRHRTTPANARDVRIGIQTVITRLDLSPFGRIPPFRASFAFVLFYRDPIQRHFLICFFVALPPIPLFLSRANLPTFQRRGSRVDYCQMFRLSDLSLRRTLFLSRQIKRRCGSIHCYLMRDL